MHKPLLMLLASRIRFLSVQLSLGLLYYVVADGSEVGEIIYAVVFNLLCVARYTIVHRYGLALAQLGCAASIAFLPSLIFQANPLGFPIANYLLILIVPLSVVCGVLWIGSFLVKRNETVSDPGA